MRFAIIIFALFTCVSASASASASAIDDSFNEFQLGAMPDGEGHELVVRLADDFLARNAVINSLIRSSINSGVEHKPSNRNFNMPSNAQILDALGVFEGVYSATGLKLYVVDYFNGFQTVMVYGAEEKDVFEVIDTLFETNYFNSIDYIKSKLGNTEKTNEIHPLGNVGADYLNDVGTQSVITPNFYNDRYYAISDHFATPSNDVRGVHGFERAIRLVRDAGVLDSGRKVNVAVVDEGFYPHEDLNIVEVFEPRMQQYPLDLFEGVVYVNRSRVTEEKLIDSSLMQTLQNRSQNVCHAGRWFDENGELRDRFLGNGHQVELNQCLKYYREDENYFLSFFNPALFCNEDNDCDLSEWDEVYDYEIGSPLMLSESHGIRVASVIGAKSNNNLGISGIIPHENLNLTIAQTLYNGSGWGHGVMLGILWASGILEHPEMEPSNYPADVINLSLSSESICYGVANNINSNQTNNPTSYNNVAELVTNSGSLIVASAGNEHSPGFWASPASCSWVFSAGASNVNGAVAFFSNYGDPIDVFALGEHVLTASTVATNQSVRDFAFATEDTTDVYRFVNGTSFSAPIVSGLAGLLKLVDSTLTPHQIKNIIRDTAVPMDDYGNCAILGCGSGIVNAENAVRFLLKGEMLGNLEATHYLSRSVFAESQEHLNRMAEFGNTCNAYQINNGVGISGSTSIEFVLYGSSGSDYEEVGRFNRADFSFQDDYDSYRLSVVNNETGAVSGLRDIYIDRTTLPEICH